MRISRRAAHLALLALSVTAFTEASGQRPTRPDTAATPLPGLIARADAEQCPRDDDPRARALWERMRSRYSPELDSASLWANLRASSGYVDAGALFQFDTVFSNRPDGTTDGWNTSEVLRDSAMRALAFVQAPRVGFGSRGMAGRLRANLNRFIERHGYGNRNPKIYADLTQISAAWSYPPLDGELGSHFISDVFGALSVFRIERAAQPVVIGFCTAARYRAAPYLSGSLVLAADTSLDVAQWHFHTSEPSEDAGGVDHFYPPQPGLSQTLLVREGDLYRRYVGNSFFHRRLIYAPWSLAMDPLLPDSLAPLSSRQGGAPLQFRSRDPVRKH
jgi:hypothetical protein